MYGAVVRASCQDLLVWLLSSGLLQMSFLLYGASSMVPLVPMCIHGLLWISMDFHAFHGRDGGRGSMYSHECIEIPWFPMVSMHFHVFSWVYKDVKGC